MKKLVLFFLVLFLVIGISFPSCDVIDGGIDCDCPPITGEYFRILDLELTNQKNNGQLIAANESVALEDYQLYLGIDPEFYSFNQQKRGWNFSFMNSALACSCVFDGYSGAKEKIEELTIITKNDFSDAYMANDTINNQFEILDIYMNENETIDEFVERGTNLQQFEGFQLFLKNAPTLNSEFKIEIHVKLDNGDEFTVENEPVIIE